VSEGRTAVIVIDMLRDFAEEGGALFVPQAAEIIPALAARLARARKDGDHVIYLCDRHSQRDREMADWPHHALEGSSGAEIVPRLAPQPGDAVIPKHTLSPFYQTDLKAVLDRLGVDTLVVTGTVTEICVLCAVVEGRPRGYNLIVPRDCVAALSDEDGRFALRLMSQVFHAEVV